MEGTIAGAADCEVKTPCAPGEGSERVAVSSEGGEAGGNGGREEVFDAGGFSMGEETAVEGESEEDSGLGEDNVVAGPIEFVTASGLFERSEVADCVPGKEGHRGRGEEKEEEDDEEYEEADFAGGCT